MFGRKAALERNTAKVREAERALLNIIAAKIKDEYFAGLVRGEISSNISDVIDEKKYKNFKLSDSKHIDQIVQMLKESQRQVISDRIEERKIALEKAGKTIEALDKAATPEEVDKTLEGLFSYSPDWSKEDRIKWMTAQALGQKYFDFKDLADSITDKKSFLKAFNAYAYDSRDINNPVTPGLQLKTMIHREIGSHFSDPSYLTYTFTTAEKALTPMERSSPAVWNKPMQAVVQYIAAQKGIIGAAL